jgi:hypothetical protein
LGLTRALLRRGLELGGWWPYLLALTDAVAAAFIIALLAITMVIGVQTFDHLAEHVGGVNARILHLDKLFDGITTQPSAPEHWWVYALLLSTMIPSLLNLMIGGASLLRGIPGLPTLLLRFMSASKAVPAFDRTWLALVLTCQVFVGVFLGIAAQFVLAIGVIFYVLPWMGLETAGHRSRCGGVRSADEGVEAVVGQFVMTSGTSMEKGQAMEPTKRFVWWSTTSR